MPIFNVTDLEEAASKLQNALLQAKQAKEEAEWTKIEARRAELKLKEANVMIFKLDKSKSILKKHVRKLMDQNKKLAKHKYVLWK